ncbi:MAG: sulfatase [Bacteroidota bacterium]
MLLRERLGWRASIPSGMEAATGFAMSSFPSDTFSHDNFTLDSFRHLETQGRIANIRYSQSMANRLYSYTMKWISFLSGFIFLTGCLLVSCQSGSSNSSDVRDRPPNVVLIFMDDMGWGDLSSFGHPTIQTPNLDRIAREGQKWTNFYTACSVCSPSRGALMTGRYPIRIGLGPTEEPKRVFFPNSTGGLPNSEITIAEMLKEEGYETGIIGKWHLGHLPQYLPTQQGFDYYYGIPYSNDMNAVGGWKVETFFKEPNINYWDVPLMENETEIERPANQHTITKRYTEKAVEFITQNKDNPFFLYFPQTMVHTPLFASESFLNTSKRGFYGDVMAEVDWSVGQVISTLESLNLDKNTLVIFTSDNGPWLMMLDHGGSAGLLTDGKGTTWEGGMRVPGIFYMPGTVQAGTITDLGSTLDILPTVAGLTGATPPSDRPMDGYNLMPVLTEKAASPRDHFVYYRLQNIHAIRKGDYKAHFTTETCYVADTRKTQHTPPLLFNVNEDPSEKYDRAESKPEVLAELVRLAEEHKKGVTAAECELNKYPPTGEEEPDRPFDEEAK